MLTCSSLFIGGILTLLSFCLVYESTSESKWFNHGSHTDDSKSHIWRVHRKTTWQKNCFVGIILIIQLINIQWILKGQLTNIDRWMLQLTAGLNTMWMIFYRFKLFDKLKRWAARLIEMISINGSLWVYKYSSIIFKYGEILGGCLLAKVKTYSHLLSSFSLFGFLF